MTDRLLSAFYFNLHLHSSSSSPYSPPPPHPPLLHLFFLPLFFFFSSPPPPPTFYPTRSHLNPIPLLQQSTCPQLTPGILDKHRWSSHHFSPLATRHATDTNQITRYPITISTHFFFSLSTHETDTFLPHPRQLRLRIVANIIDIC